MGTRLFAVVSPVLSTIGMDLFRMFNAVFGFTGTLLFSVRRTPLGLDFFMTHLFSVT
jgi:hypothetical protein